MSAIYQAFSNCFGYLWSNNNEIVTLHQGETVPLTVFVKTIRALNKLGGYQFKIRLERDVYFKATNPSYSFPTLQGCESSAVILRNLKLIDENNEMHKDTALVVRNSFKIRGLGAIRLNPYNGNPLRVKKIELREISSNKKAQ